VSDRTRTKSRRYAGTVLMDAAGSARRLRLGGSSHLRPAVTLAPAPVEPSAASLTTGQLSVVVAPPRAFDERLNEDFIED